MTNFNKIILLFLPIFVLVSCSKTPSRVNDLTLFGLKGPVESIIIKRDYENTDLADKNYMTSSTKLIFNDRGFMTSESRVNTIPSNPDAKPRLSSENYHFDSAGRIQKQISHSQPSDLTETMFLYKKGANLPYAAISGDKVHSYMSTLSYDDKGRLNSVSLFDKEWNNIFSVQTTYNDDDQKISQKSTHESELISESYYYYNSQGFISSIAEHYQNKSKSLLTYEYLKSDDYGNWLERKEISDKKLGYVIEKRTIHYF